MTRKLTVFLGALLAVSACTSIDCPVQHTVRSYYAIYNANQKNDTLRDTLTVFIHRVNGTDTALLNSSANKTAFSLPVSYSNAVDTLYFQFRRHPFRAVDTVWVYKENIPHFESVDCPTSFFHHITSVRTTHYAIDSITIKNPTIDYDPETVHFYLYPKSHD